MNASRIGAALLAATMATALAACGDTWRGVKQDTGENLEKTGNAIERGGERINPNK